MAKFNSLQEIFDVIWQKFVVEKSPQSIDWFPDKASRCRYRGPNGSCCFFGACIPDDKYSLILESQSAIAVARYLPDVFDPRVIGGPLDDTLNDLQCIHDEADPKNFHADIVPKLQAFAQQHNLTVPAPN